jgi:uncharacterized protein
MLVKIEEIQEPGLELTEALKPEVFAEALKDAGDFRLDSATPLEAQFKKVSKQVHVKGAFTAQVTAPCKRCLADVQLEVPVSFTLRMVVDKAPREHEGAVFDEAAAIAESKGAGRGGGRKRAQEPQDDGQSEHAGSFELDEIDAEPFDGKTIDLDPIVREQVLLALPVSVLCREECKGLCTVCGTDLNVKDCGHSNLKEVDVRLAKLKDIKLQN